MNRIEKYMYLGPGQCVRCPQRFRFIQWNKSLEFLTQKQKNTPKILCLLDTSIFFNYITKIRFLRPCFLNQAAIFLHLEIIKICLLFLISLPLCFDLSFFRWFSFLLPTTWLEGQLFSLGAMKLWSSLYKVCRPNNYFLLEFPMSHQRVISPSTPAITDSL